MPNLAQAQTVAQFGNAFVMNEMGDSRAVCISENGNPPLHFIHPSMQLTHWGRDKMAAIFQTTFSNAFS